MSVRPNMGRKNSGNSGAILEKRLARAEKTIRQTPSRVGIPPRLFARINWYFNATTGADECKGLIAPDGNNARVSTSAVWIDWLSSCRPVAFGDVIYEIEPMHQRVTRNAVQLPLYRAVRPLATTTGTAPSTATIALQSTGGVTRMTIGEFAIPTTGMLSVNRVPLWRSNDYSATTDLDLTYRQMTLHPYGTAATLYVPSPPLYNAAGELVTKLGLAALAQDTFLLGSPDQASAYFHASHLQSVPIRPTLAITGTGRTTNAAPTAGQCLVAATDSQGTIFWDYQTVGTPPGGAGHAWDFMRVNAGGTAWTSYGMGDIEYFDGSVAPFKNRIQIGANNNGKGITQLAVSNRFLVNSTGSVEWIQSGTEIAGTDQWNVIKVTGSDIVFNDNGFECLRWVNYVTGAQRAWKFQIPSIMQDRVIIDTTSDVEWYVRGGAIFSGSDKYARMIKSGSDVQFQDDGTEVLRWTCSATPSLRGFTFKVDVWNTNKYSQYDSTALNTWGFNSAATNIWNMAVNGVSWLIFDNAAATPTLKMASAVDFSLNSRKLYTTLAGSGDYIYDNAGQFTITVASKMLCSGDIDIAAGKVYRANGTAGISGAFSYKDSAGTNHTFTFTAGLLTAQV